jgi:hypothetical protein
VLHLEAPVDGDGMVDRGEHREAPSLDGEQPVAEALVVVDDVEVVPTVAQVLGGPDAERERLGEGAGAERGDLDPVAEVLSSHTPGQAHGEVVVVDVEARQLDQRDPRVELGVGLAAEHLDPVAEVGQRLAEVADVHALAAHVGLAPVGEQGDAQGCLGTVHEWNSLPVT